MGPVLRRWAFACTLSRLLNLAAFPRGHAAITFVDVGVGFADRAAIVVAVGLLRGWTQTDYQNKHYNINQKDEGTWDDRGRDRGTSFILRIKEQETRLTLQEHDDDDDDK
jgi:hypothetical protein